MLEPLLVPVEVYGSLPGYGSIVNLAAFDGFRLNILPNRLKLWDYIIDIW